MLRPCENLVTACQSARNVQLWRAEKRYSREERITNEEYPTFDYRVHRINIKMRWGGRYSAINSNTDGVHLEPLEVDNIMMDEREEEMGTRYVFISPLYSMTSEWIDLFPL